MSHTLNEILTQPQAWREAVTQTLDGPGEWVAPLRQAEEVVFTGCGSTYHLSVAAAALFRQVAGVAARAVPGGELALNPDLYLPRGRATLVAVSRSGATDETLEAVARFREHHPRGFVLAITTQGEQPLSQRSDAAIVLPAAREVSVVQTRSFAAMYVAAVGVAVRVADRTDLAATLHALSDVGPNLIERAQHQVPRWKAVTARGPVFFLGSGFYFGLAAELSLKMKEMSLTFSEAYPFLEFRHGPMSLVEPGTVVVGLVSRSHARHQRAVLEEMAALGAHIVTVEPAPGRGMRFALPGGLPDEVRGVLYLPPLQLLAYHRAVAKGLNPDRPRHLNAVVHLNLNPGMAGEV